MKFRTQISVAPSSVNISHQHKTLCIGSCFAEHIGERLDGKKFPVLVNPFGIVYNPISVVHVMERLISGEQFTEEGLFENHGLWHSYAHHGRFSHPDKSVVLANINSTLEAAGFYLKNTSRIILTFGTANVFALKEDGEIVANCHKMPGQTFERRRLSVNEIASSIIACLQALKSKLPELEVVTTVSPVRHLRDGLIENQRSKATLVLALEQITKELPFVHYFPAFEILLDDLRDYRFYERDMSHPNVMAVDYVWEKFGETYFSEETKQLNSRVEQIIAAAAHRPFHPESVEHKAFLQKQLTIISVLEQEYTMLDFEKEKLIFSGNT